MAYTNPGGGESPKEDYFGDGDMPKENEENPSTAVLPKSILAGKKFNVGDEVVLKIDRINEDSVEVSYSYEGTEDEQKEHEEGMEEEVKPPAQMSESYMD